MLARTARNRDHYRTVITPSALQAASDGGITNPGLFSPKAEVLRNTVDSQHSGLPSVQSLLATGCPADVARLVMAVNVDSVKAVRGTRAKADSGNELFERFKAKFNTASTIVRVAFVARILTARLRVIERFKLGGRLAVTRVSVRRLVFGKSFAVIAPAGTGQSFDQRGTVYDFASAAIALDIPKRVAELVRVAFDGYPSESLSGQINEAGVGWGRWKRFGHCFDNVMGCHNSL